MLHTCLHQSCFLQLLYIYTCSLQKHFHIFIVLYIWPVTQLSPPSSQAMLMEYQYRPLKGVMVRLSSSHHYLCSRSHLQRFPNPLARFFVVLLQRKGRVAEKGRTGENRGIYPPLGTLRKPPFTLHHLNRFPQRQLKPLPQSCSKIFLLREGIEWLTFPFLFLFLYLVPFPCLSCLFPSPFLTFPFLRSRNPEIQVGGSGGVLWVPPGESGAKPQPISNLMHFSHKIWHLVATADGKDLVILACTAFDWSTRVTDGQTELRIAKTRSKQ